MHAPGSDLAKCSSFQDYLHGKWMCGNYALILELFTTIVVRMEILEPIYGGPGPLTLICEAQNLSSLGPV